MRRWICGLLIVLLCGVAYAQDEPKPDQLKKMYDDTLVQLKSAQERKNELAKENEKLNARVAELQKQNESLRREAAGSADKTYMLRSHFAAWEAFISKYPAISARWKVFMEADVLATPMGIFENSNDQIPMTNE